jgi:hypothetical protein
MEGDLAGWTSHMAIMWRRASPESGMFSDERQRRFQSRPLLHYDIESQIGLNLLMTSSKLSTAATVFFFFREFLGVEKGTLFPFSITFHS